MKVVYLDLPINHKFTRSVIGLGYFDGVHLGHQDLINNVIKLAKEKHVKSSIFTFDIPIRKLFNKEFYGELTPLKYKLEIFKKIGLDICYVLRFNKDIASMDKSLFIGEILDKLNLESIVIGSDFKFGNKAEGDAILLKKHYPTYIVDFVNISGIKVSSSSIIEWIRNGLISKANKEIDDSRKYFIEGKVIHGLGNGKKFGLPTANVNYNGFVLPKNGVYKVSVKYRNKFYKGVANIGLHPTIEKLQSPTLEVFIDHFHKNIYNKSIRVYFIEYLRDEERFDSLEKLVNKVKDDLSK